MGDLTYELVNGGVLAPDNVTDVEEEEAVPTSWGLYQNYPNPFNPSTTILFTVPEASQIEITLYNCIGKEVDVILNDFYSAGNHSVNYTPQNLASGIYFYRLASENYSDVKKLILMK